MGKKKKVSVALHLVNSSLKKTQLTQPPCSARLCAEPRWSCPASVTPWTLAGQAALATDFCGQEDWSGLPRPLPRSFSIQGPSPHLLGLPAPPLAGGFSTTGATGKP